MHKDHKVFMQALKDNRKIILTYFSNMKDFYITKLLIPVYHRSAFSKWSTDIYYFWNSEADGNRMLALPTTKIKFMKLSNEIFKEANYVKPENNKEC